MYDELVAGNNFDSIDDGIYNFSLEGDVVKIKDKSGNDIDTSQIFSKEYFRNMICKQLKVTSIVVVSNYAAFDKTKLTRGMRQYYNYMQKHNLMAGKKSVMLEFENGKFAVVSKDIPEEPDTAQCFKVDDDTGTIIEGWNSTGACPAEPYQNLFIPEKINDIIIKKIGSSAFENNNISYFHGSEKIISVGDYAFFNNTIRGALSLKAGYIGNYSFFFDNTCPANPINQLTFSSNVRTIGKYAFNCIAISGVPYIIVPNTVTNIGLNAVVATYGCIKDNASGTGCGCSGGASLSNCSL